MLTWPSSVDCPTTTTAPIEQIKLERAKPAFISPATLQRESLDWINNVGKNGRVPIECDQDKQDPLRE